MGRSMRLGSSLSISTFCVVVLGIFACSNNDSTKQSGSGTIGAYCDELLPVFCNYAVTTCGLTGTVNGCIADARNACCQGTCGRAAQPIDDDALRRCQQAYTGQSAGGASGAAGGGGTSALSCADVLAGSTPASCRDIIQLLAAPPEQRGAQ